jgi:hypothetical protein
MKIILIKISAAVSKSLVRADSKVIGLNKKRLTFEVSLFNDTN